MPLRPCLLYTSEYAAQLAAKEQNPRRREELLKISEVNARVPAHKPETFWEAIQAVWTIESLLVVEENQTGMSIGRVDQYMYPFYKGDIASGRLNDRQAFELAGCMLIKMSEMMLSLIHILKNGAPIVFHLRLRK